MSSQHVKVFSLGLAFGLAAHLLLAASSSAQTDREIERLRSELRNTNRYLEQMARSLDRIDDAFSGSQLRVRSER